MLINMLINKILIPHSKYLFGLLLNKRLLSCEIYTGKIGNFFENNINVSLSNVSTTDLIVSPLIYHIRNENENDIIDIIHQETNLPHKYINELINFGCIYLSIPDERIKLSKSTGSPGIRINGMSKSKRINNNIIVPIGSYIRIHANPKRYFNVYKINWLNNIIFPKNRNDIILVDKILTNIPISSTVDNAIENILYQVTKVTNLKLHVTSRLDVCTSGLIPLAISNHASKVHKMVANKKIIKKYKILCYNKVKLGNIKHCFRSKRQGHENSKPSLLRDFDPELLSTRNLENINESSYDWQLAELSIDSCLEVNKNELNMKEINEIDEFHERYFECQVTLITGKTHQIRLQFAALNSPIIGDTRYNPIAGLLDSDDEVWGNGNKLMGIDPFKIGLQCAELIFPLPYENHSINSINNKDDEIDTIFKASKPWWRI